MFILKSCCKFSGDVFDLSVENLSSYDINVSVSYSESIIDRSDYFMLRYVGVDNQSSLEISVMDGLLCEVGLRCFNGNAVINLSSPWTRPEKISSEMPTFRLAMSDENVGVSFGLHRVDLHKDFDFLIYSDAVVFMVDNRGIYKSLFFGKNLLILLGDVA